MIDRCNHPWQSQSEENVDGVGSGDVADRVVGSPIHQGRLLAGEQIWQAGSHGDECDRRDGVLEADEAAEDGGKVTHDGGQHADHQQGDDERQPTTEYRRRWNKCEDQLESHKINSTVLNVDK